MFNLFRVRRTSTRFYAALFLAFFLLFFLQLPIRGQLPGNTDTLLAIALSNLSFERLKLFLAGATSFTAMYPAHDVMAYGENCYGLVLLFELLKFLTRSDLWAYYFFVSTIFALNSLGVFIFVGLFVDDRKISALAAVTFSLLGFLLGSIDDPNVIFLFFPLASLYCLELAVRRQRRDLAVAGLVLSSLQIWFGFYDFVYLFLVLAVWALVNARACRAFLKLKDLPALLLAYLGPAAPLIALYAFDHFHADIFSPYNLQVTMKNASLGWNNFWNVGPHNLFYSDSNNVYGPLDVGGWHRTRKNCFVGFVFPLCFLWGVVAEGRRTCAYLAIFALFFTLSFGTHLPGFDSLIELPLAGYLRIPLRFLLVALVPAALYFALGLNRARKWIRDRFPARPVLAGALVTIIGVAAIVENMPVPLRGFDLGDQLSPPDGYVEYFSKFPQPQVILDLPSTCFYVPADHANEFANLWFYSRDILYMNWQTYHKQIIVNGVNSYVPRIRAELDREFQRVPDPSALAALRAAGVRHVVFHKKMVLAPREDVLSLLKRSPGLVEKFENDDIAIFEVSA